MIDPRISEGFNRRATFNEGMLPDKNGMYLWISIAKGQAPDVDETVVEFKNELRGGTIHRGEFVDELAKLVEPDRCHFSKRLTSIQESSEDDSITLNFEDGCTVEADVVIGADGIHSVVRKEILGVDHPAANAFFSGVIAYRCVVPLDVAKAKLGDTRPRFVIRCGENGMVFGFPMSENSVYFLEVTTDNNGPVSAKRWLVTPDKDDLIARFADWDDFARKQVELVPTDANTLGWPVWQMPLAPTYIKGRVAMMGDAAHATTPFLGAGSGQAFEDALVLERLLGNAFEPARSRKFPPSVPETATCVLQAFDTTRRFRTQWVVAKSAESGRIFTGKQPGTTMAAAEMFKRLEHVTDFVWKVDQTQQISDTLLLFEEYENCAANAAHKQGAEPILALSAPQGS